MSSTNQAGDREQLAAAFKAGQLSLDDYWMRIKALPAPWHSARWDARKAAMIGDSCAGCGARGDGVILVLQHRWHPAPYSVHCERVKPALRESYAKQHPLIRPKLRTFKESSVVFKAEERDLCPKCGSPVVVFLKTESTWKCNGKKSRGSYRGSIQCGHRFDKPIRGLWSRYTREEQIQKARHDHDAPLHQAYFDWERRFVAACRDEIMRAGTLLNIEEHERYMAMNPEDIATLCKSCAFKEDARAGKIAGRF